MNANELRIGNFLKIGQEHESYNCLGKVIKWELSNFYSLEKGYNNIEWFEPIPLTEEWLLKFGFEKVYDGNYKRYQINLLDTNIYLRPSLDKWYFGFVNNGQDCEINDCYELEFLHEIQNLIFSLTRKELVLSDAVS